MGGAHLERLFIAGAMAATRPCSRSTVSMLCAKTSKPCCEGARLRRRRGSPVSALQNVRLQSLTSAPSQVLGAAVRHRRGPPTSTMYPTPHFATASAVFSGPPDPAARGLLAFTAQKRHSRVHVSPMIMMARPVSPFQHRPGWGHRLLAHRGQPETAHVRGDLRASSPEGAPVAGFVRPRGGRGRRCRRGVHRNGRGPHRARRAGRRTSTPSFASCTRRSNASPDAPGARAPLLGRGEPRPTPAAEPSPSAARARQTSRDDRERDATRLIRARG